MADVVVTTSLCSNHCLHYGVTGLASGAGRCCFCGNDFGTPAPTSANSQIIEDSRTPAGAYPDGAYYAAIVAAGGNV